MTKSTQYFWYLLLFSAFRQENGLVIRRFSLGFKKKFVTLNQSREGLKRTLKCYEGIFMSFKPPAGELVIGRPINMSPVFAAWRMSPALLASRVCERNVRLSVRTTLKSNNWKSFPFVVVVWHGYGSKTAVCVKYMTKTCTNYLYVLWQISKLQICKNFLAK